MKSIKILILTSIFTFGFLMSCKDDNIELVPKWESGVHGLGDFAPGSAESFLVGDPSVELDFTLRWVSIDNKAEVTKMEVYVSFSEPYIDPDDLPATANHDGGEGVLLKTFEGAGLPADSEDVPFAVSQDDIYQLFKDYTYDYDKDPATAETPVFNNPDAPDRSPANPFIKGDVFSIRWEFTTEDGRVFNAWSPSVCNEFPGANCSISWGVVCSQVINYPVGDWTIDFEDSYGDGWNGAAIRVTVDGVATDYTLDNGFSGTTVVTVPPGTTTLTFAYVSGDWDSEASFTITSERGNEIAKGGPSQVAGILVLDLCKDNL